MPLFSNTCGKLFSDTVVFASVSSENKIPVEDIKNISFKRSVVWSNLLFLVVPLCVFALSRMVKNDDTFIKFFLYGIASLFAIICLIKVQKKFTIQIRMNNGALYTIRVSIDNVKDTQKFIDKATKLIKEQQAAAQNSTIAAKKEQAAFSKSVSNIIHH